VTFQTSKRVDETFVGVVPSPTAQEAKHAVAVVALHNYCGNTNMVKVLHPQYRELWELLDQQKKENDTKLKLKQIEEEKAAKLAAVSAAEPKQVLPQMYLLLL
jgi:hypothetical protein